MSYNPLTDFLALLRTTTGGVRTEQMPGLDWWIAAMSRAGIISLSVGQTAPTTNQATTVWFKPALPSWTAEGTVFLWNAAVLAYQPATPALWNAFFSPSGYNFQEITAANGVVNAGVSLLAVVRNAPTATALILPSLAAQFTTGKKLQLIDFSTNVANHVITLTTPDGATIMQQNAWNMVSTPDQLAGLMLQPSPDLNAWIIAP